MQILDLLGMYFDAVVVFVTNSSLLFRFTLAILWDVIVDFSIFCAQLCKIGHVGNLNFPPRPHFFCY